MFLSWNWKQQVLATGFLIICTIKTAYSIGDDHHLDGPIIIPSESEIILKNGQNFTIYCQANALVQIKRQEIPEDSSDTFKMRLRNVTSFDPKYRFKVALDLFNVDQFAIGYYACFDETIDENDILYDIIEEPKNNDHVSYIYVYVNGTGLLFAPMQDFVRMRSNSKFIIKCRPTTPDVNVTLIGEIPDSYSPKLGFTIDTEYPSSLITFITCDYERGKTTQSKDVVINKSTYEKPPKPKIQIETTMFMKGDTFSLNCSVSYQSNSAMLLTWEIPGGNISLVEGRMLNVTNEHEVTEGFLYNNITITNATEKDAGKYICICKNTFANSEAAVKMIFKERAFVELKQYIKNPVITNLTEYTYLGGISSYPRATVQVWKNGICCLRNDTSKYNLMDQVDDIKFRIYNLNINDTANYTFVATNKFETKNMTLDLRVRAAPSVEIISAANKKFLLNTTASLLCKAIGYPLPEITWIFRDQSGKDWWPYGAENRADSLIQVTSELKVPALNSGNITCHAQNKEGNASSVRNFIVYEVPNGFGLENSDNRWYPEGEDVEIDCYASKADFTNVTWIRDGIDIPLESVKMLNSSLSYIARLWIKNVTLEDEANYTCQGSKDGYTEDEETIFITVGEKRRLEFTEPLMDSEIEAAQFQIIQLKCQAAAVPPPQITWHKDNEPLENCTDTEIYTEYINDISTIVNTSVTIKMSSKYAGKYECIATSGGISEKRAYNVVINESIPFKSKYLTIPVVIVLVLILVVVYLAWKIRKEKRFRKELAAAGLLNFKEGVPKSLNPDLGIDEQAELLPYDEKFEFPPEKLIIGKQLGAGAFGVVYKAEARGIINAEEVTPVAVKMVKKTADNMHIKALASELKIMVHLGKHVNIVNLLGACTKNAGKRELIVIVEYCKFGNIHNYMQRHRHVFIDQLTDNKDKNMGKVNKAFSSSSASTGMQSDYFGSNHTQSTDHTFVNTANSNRSGRKDNPKQVEFAKASETGYIQPEWRTNYESDYSFDGRSPRPLTSRDLLAWAFQIARGMEYLASRKVLHGDLAARNVLLADDNVVKICDFGLARSMYKNDEYRKQENSPLPIKWLAIECMTDRIFSTQSDVWSFGVVLWELFSLAKTPYPNVSPSNFLQHLNDGHRLERPQYADDQLYDIMCRCWDKKPTARPNFTQLQEILGNFLEANVRNHYVDLNSMYNDMNQKQDGQEDYLARVCAPDYNNLVTPSPHHYVNDAQSFFPPLNEIPHDGDGYLQMTPATRQSIFSPRATGNKFDFDPRKMDVRMTEPNCQGSELTPMLTLNNLPAKSSESDHEGSSLPYINTYPPLDEETDDVFEMEQYNLKNEQLNKNSQNSAVTNPTYISFDVDKKPQNFSNNYINSNVPNGLVK